MNAPEPIHLDNKDTVGKFGGEYRNVTCSKCGRYDVPEHFIVIADNPEGENPKVVCWPKCNMPQGQEVTGKEEFFYEGNDLAFGAAGGA